MKKLKHVLIGLIIGTGVLAVSAYNTNTWDPVQYIKKLFLTTNGSLEASKAAIKLDGETGRIDAKSIYMNNEKVITETYVKSEIEKLKSNLKQLNESNKNESSSLSNGLISKDDYYIADSRNGTRCSNLSEDIKSKCIDKESSGKYSVWVYPFVEFNDIKDAKYLLYAMTNKLRVEKKSSNCSAGYKVGTLKTITVFAALYKEKIRYRNKIEDIYSFWWEPCGFKGTHVKQGHSWDLRWTSNVGTRCYVWTLNDERIRAATTTTAKRFILGGFRTCYKITQ